MTITIASELRVDACAAVRVLPGDCDCMDTL